MNKGYEENHNVYVVCFLRRRLLSASTSHFPQSATPLTPLDKKQPNVHIQGMQLLICYFLFLGNWYLRFPRVKQGIFNVVQRRIHISKPLFFLDHLTEANQICALSVTGTEVLCMLFVFFMPKQWFLVWFRGGVCTQY